MAEQLRRTTMEQIPSGDYIMIGHGQNSEVFLNLRTPGICYKIPYYWRDEEAKKVESTYDYLKSSGLPVIPYFKVAWGGEFFEMTELTNGQTNLVVSLPDISRVEDMAERQKWFDEWRSIVPINTSDFIQNLHRIFDIAVASKIRINNVGFFLIASPEGKLETILADYDDGILHDRTGIDYTQKEIDEQKTRIRDYLQVVGNFFPKISQEKFD